MSDPNVFDDSELFRRAKRSEKAFELLYKEYSLPVYTWFRRHSTSDPAEAADLTAEVFARVILSLHRFRGARPGSGTAWLFRIVHNLTADRARRSRIENRARARLRLDGDYVPEPTEDVELRLAAEELSPNVLEAFQALTEQQQTAVRLRVVDELTYDEIAVRTNSTNQASRLHVMRGLRRLRELVSDTREERD